MKNLKKLFCLPDKGTVWELTMGFWLLRAWIAVRAIFTGLNKFESKKIVPANMDEVKGKTAEEIAEMIEFGEIDTVTAKVYSLDTYHGLPQGGGMTVSDFLQEPAMPSFLVEPYANCLGYALILLGVATLLGICTRISLFLQGMLYVSLTFGFVILEDVIGPNSNAGASAMGIHLLIIVAALFLVKNNRLCLCEADRFLFNNSSARKNFKRDFKRK